MTFGSLFSGIGGMDLGLQRAGMDCCWQVENNTFCQKVLTKHWPGVKKYGDITLIEGSELEYCDLICGGFPCQDISNQGAVHSARQGTDGSRSGLWWHMHRIVDRVRPRFVLVENVQQVTKNGLTNILGALDESGYDAEWDCLPASAFGAPHQRDRVFVVAYDRSKRIQRSGQTSIPWFGCFPWFENVRGIEDLRERPDLPPSLFRGSRDGVPYWVDRLRGCGNAVVPCVAEWIGRRILEVS